MRCNFKLNSLATLLACCTAAQLSLAQQAAQLDPAEVGVEPPSAVIDAATLFELDANRGADVAQYLFPAADAYDQFAPRQQVTLEHMPLSDTLRVDLELERFHAYAIGAQFVIGTEAGDVPVAAPALATFRGHAPGWPDSWAVIGVTREHVFGIVQLSPNEEYWIAPPAADAFGQPHAVYERFTAAEHLPRFDFRCETVAEPGHFPPAETGNAGTGEPDAFTWRVVELALDGDWQYRQLFSTPEAGLEYLSLLTAVISAIYERDMQIKLALVYARVWNTSNDPYSANSTSAALEEFRDYWNDNMGHVPRNSAHLLSGKDLGGGRAYRAALCNSDAYGVNEVDGTFPYPVQNQNMGNWDIFVVSHELGHSVGSPHTHCYDPPIDTCAGTGYDCPHTQVCQVGTIMSYCHLCSGGVANIDLRFHSRVVSVIRDFIDDECPRYGRNPCYVNISYGGNEQGTSSQPYDTVLEGAQYVVPGGSVRIAPGNYNQRFINAYILNRPMTLERWGSSGVARIGTN